MAKKSTKKSGVITSFKDLVDFQKKLNSDADIMSDSDYSKITEYIHTGNFMLNACICGHILGGIPNNKIVALAGDSQTSKTVTCLNVARNAQLAGYDVVYYDTENAVNVNMMTSFGVDPERVLYIPISIVEDLKNNLTSMLDALVETKKNDEEIPKLFIVIDSLSQLGTLKQEQDALDFKQSTDLTRAKAIKSMFQLITNKLASLKYPMIFTNHTYTNEIGFVKAHEKIKVTGGKSIEYTASVILHYSRTQMDEDKGKSEKTGISVVVQPMKNRLVKPKRVVYHIPWNDTINPFIGLEEYIDLPASEEELAMRIWEKVGIGRGTLKKLKNGEYQFEFKARSTTWAVRHLGENIKRSDASRIFSSEVFTNEVLANLDPFIFEDFSYASTRDDGQAKEFEADLASFLVDNTDFYDSLLEA